MAFRHRALLQAHSLFTNETLIPLVVDDCSKKRPVPRGIVCHGETV